jgi:hypothetical protein
MRETEEVIVFQSDRDRVSPGGSVRRRVR